MRHIANVILVIAIVALSAANTAVFLQGRRASAPAATQPADAGERWLAFSTAERVAYVKQYQELAQREDTGLVLRRARRFAQLRPAEQERLRDVLRLLHETLDKQPPGKRSDWLRSSEQTRAFLVYRALLADEPERIKALRP
ncbi:MAG: hypothetical protein KAY37_10320 [Phycisphaerae bacterium]|nr:hypothetical protein [Phycisphaerae bacterium]